MITFYDILGVPPNADKATINAVYREKIRNYTAEIKGTSTDPRRLAELRELNEAHDTLDHPEKRAFYDLGLKSRPAGAAGSSTGNAWLDAFRKQARHMCFVREVKLKIISAAILAPSFYNMTKPSFMEFAFLAVSGSVFSIMMYAGSRKKAMGADAVNRVLDRHYEEFAAKNPAGDQFKLYAREAAKDIFAPVFVAKQFFARRFSLRNSR